jgi:hypothetical protein
VELSAPVPELFLQLLETGISLVGQTGVVDCAVLPLLRFPMIRTSMSRIWRVCKGSFLPLPNDVPILVTKEIKRRGIDRVAKFELRKFNKRV